MVRGRPAYANLLAAPPELWQARATTGKPGWEKIKGEKGGEVVKWLDPLALLPLQLNCHV